MVPVMPQMLTQLAAVKCFIKEFRMWIYFTLLGVGGRGGMAISGKGGKLHPPR